MLITVHFTYWRIHCQCQKQFLTEVLLYNCMLTLKTCGNAYIVKPKIKKNDKFIALTRMMVNVMCSSTSRNRPHHTVITIFDTFVAMKINQGRIFDMQGFQLHWINIPVKHSCLISPCFFLFFREHQRRCLAAFLAHLAPVVFDLCFHCFHRLYILSLGNALHILMDSLLSDFKAAV